MQTDVLIIGSGIAGATAAIRLAEDRERQITVITRAPRASESKSHYAQGGIVGRGHEDSAELLIEDVHRAGDGLCYPPAVEVLAEEGPRVVREVLIEGAKVPFDRDESGALAFGLEGAHSQRRILHVGDMAGKAIMQALIGQLLDPLSREPPQILRRLDRLQQLPLRHRFLRTA